MIATSAICSSIFARSACHARRRGDTKECIFSPSVQLKPVKGSIPLARAGNEAVRKSSLSAGGEEMEETLPQARESDKFAVHLLAER